MPGEDWRRLSDYVVARRVYLGMRDRRAFAEATGVTDRTLGKLENGQQVSPSTLGVVENQLGWGPGSCRRILAGGEPVTEPAEHGRAEYDDPTLRHLANTPGLPSDVVRGLIALARNWQQGGGGIGEQAQRRALPRGTTSQAPASSGPAKRPPRGTPRCPGSSRSGGSGPAKARVRAAADGSARGLARAGSARWTASAARTPTRSAAASPAARPMAPRPRAPG